MYSRYLHGAMGDQGMSQADLDGMKAGTENLANSALAAVQRA